MKTTTTTPGAAGPILALDLGKYKSVAYLYDPAAGAAARLTVPNARGAVAPARSFVYRA
jgi:hypothetical protein